MTDKYLKEAGNVHLAYYVAAADKLGIDYEVKIRSYLAKFTSKGKHWYIINASVPINNEPSSTLARNKDQSYMVFKDFKIPVAEQVKLSSIDEAYEFFNKFKDIVIKPIRNLGGNGVSVLPQSIEDVKEAYELAVQKDMSKSKIHVLGEQFISGQNYRLLVLEDRVLGVVRRRPAHVVGDGSSTIAELLESVNKLRSEKLLKQIKIDDQAKIKMKTDGLTLETVPENGIAVDLRFNSNLSTGGTTEECAAQLDPYYAQLAIKTVKALGLKLGGVDLIATDISDPKAEHVINEVNTNPGLRVHYMVEKGDVVDVAVEVMKYIENL